MIHGKKGLGGSLLRLPIPDLAVALVDWVQLGGQHLTSASVARPAGPYAGSRARLLRLAFAADSRYNLWHSPEESASGFTDHPVDPLQKQWRDQSK
jgi:hypothetical protein